MISPFDYEISSEAFDGEDEGAPLPDDDLIPDDFVDEDGDGEDDFYRNLAEDISQERLNKIANELVEGIQDDRNSRSEWEATTATGMELLGVNPNSYGSMKPFFTDSCGAYDPAILKALLYYYSTAKASLFPAVGPAKSKTNGSPNQKTQDEADRVKLFMNYFLTDLDRKYYPDSDNLIWNTGIAGSAFRKVCMNKIKNMPTSYFINAKDFLVNPNTRSLLESSRMTEILYLSRKEIMLKQRDGDFIRFEVPESSDSDEDDGQSAIADKAKELSGVQADDQQNKSLFKFYECHVDLDESDLGGSKSGNGKKSGIPKPYVVIIFAQTSKICSIRRNWKEEDNNYERLECYVNYLYLPGFGIYGMGLAQILGASAKALTSIIRQLVDKGLLSNYPGGLIDSSIRLEKNNIMVGPAEFQPIETGGRPITDCVSMMPYGEPSQVLAQLRQSLQEDVASISGVLAMEIPEGSQNAPVGTTYVKLEVATALQSTVLKSLHTSLGYELKLLFDLFGKYLPDEPYPFSVPGKDTAIMRQDFSDRINIVPISDPNAMTSSQLMIRSQTVLQTAQMFPQVHDMREACYRFYTAMNVEDIDKLLPKPAEPAALDASTENMKILIGQPVLVDLNQNHPEHIIVHSDFLNNPMIQQNPMAYAALVAHKQEHEAAEIYMQYQNQMMQGGMAPPQEMMPKSVSEILMIPEIQNMVSAKSAEEVKQRQEEMARQQQEAMQNQIDPNQVAVMDIEQHREAAHLKAEETKLKTEAEVYKADLKHEQETTKIEAQLQMANEKNEVDVAIELSKQESQANKQHK